MEPLLAKFRLREPCKKPTLSTDWSISVYNRIMIEKNEPSVAFGFFKQGSARRLVRTKNKSVSCNDTYTYTPGAIMRLPGVEPGSIAWKAIILTVGL
ncbi:hypothetical protein V6N12_057876 [Hibiscus sabdariffa]|uniref:Uncharacterized protein n=1 Tax=Hibiscus sabdariffa TaxID=183260 RepID=A0ABR2B4L3_9ROSI